MCFLSPLVASQVGQTQGHQQVALEEPGPAESVPPDASPHVHVITDIAQQDTLIESPALSPRGSSAQTDEETNMRPRRDDSDRLEKLPKEQDKYPFSIWR
jgi:hypothetical protein